MLQIPCIIQISIESDCSGPKHEEGNRNSSPVMRFAKLNKPPFKGRLNRWIYGKLVAQYNSAKFLHIKENFFRNYGVAESFEFVTEKCKQEQSADKATAHVWHVSGK